MSEGIENCKMSEKLGKSQGILKLMISGNPGLQEYLHKIQKKKEEKKNDSPETPESTNGLIQMITIDKFIGQERVKKRQELFTSKPTKKF